MWQQRQSLPTHVGQQRQSLHTCGAAAAVTTHLWGSSGSHYTPVGQQWQSLHTCGAAAAVTTTHVGAAAAVTTHLWGSSGGHYTPVGWQWQSLNTCGAAAAVVMHSNGSHCHCRYTLIGRQRLLLHKEASASYQSRALRTHGSTRHHTRQWRSGGAAVPDGQSLEEAAVCSLPEEVGRPARRRDSPDHGGEHGRVQFGAHHLG